MRSNIQDFFSKADSTIHCHWVNDHCQLYLDNCHQSQNLTVGILLPRYCFTRVGLLTEVKKKAAAPVISLVNTHTLYIYTYTCIEKCMYNIHAWCISMLQCIFTLNELETWKFCLMKLNIISKFQWPDAIKCRFTMESNNV